jgi:hypothetical protein
MPITASAGRSGTRLITVCLANGMSAGVGKGETSVPQEVTESMPRNQVEEIFGAFKVLQKATVDELVEATDWSWHVVEVTMGLLVECGMARCITVDNDAAEPVYEVIVR